MYFQSAPPASAAAARAAIDVPEMNPVRSKPQFTVNCEAICSYCALVVMSVRDDMTGLYRAHLLILLLRQSEARS